MSRPEQRNCTKLPPPAYPTPAHGDASRHPKPSENATPLPPAAQSSAASSLTPAAPSPSSSSPSTEPPPSYQAATGGSNSVFTSESEKRTSSNSETTSVPDSDPDFLVLPDLPDVPLSAIYRPGGVKRRGIDFPAGPGRYW